MSLFVLLPIIYAAFIAWASFGCYKKMISKDAPEIHKPAKKTFIGMAVFGTAGLASFILLINYTNGFHLGISALAGVIQIIILSALIVSAVLFLVFWTNGPSRSLIMQYQIKNQNRVKFEQALTEAGFETGKKIECNGEAGFFIDADKKMIALCNYLSGGNFILSFSKILNCEVIENNNVAFTGASRTFNIVKYLKIKIITDDVLNAMRMIDLIQNEISKDSNYYKSAMYFAQEVYSAVFSIIEKNKTGLKQQSKQY